MSKKTGRPVQWSGIKKGSSRLLRILLRKYDLGSKIKENPNIITYWWRSGYVPLKKVGRIARLTGIDPYLLNYVQVQDIVPSKKRWEDRVKACSITAQEKVYVLNGTSPEIHHFDY